MRLTDALIVPPFLAFVYLGLAAFLGLPLPGDLELQAWFYFTLAPTWFALSLVGRLAVEFLEN